MVQLVLLNNSNARLCKGLTNVDNKLQALLIADNRTKTLALPIPVIPVAFLNLLPIKNIEQLEIVESLLSTDNNNSVALKENLKSFLLLKVGALGISSAVREAVNCCFDSSILGLFSLKGKTKKRFIDLQLFSIIYGFRISSVDEQKFLSVLDDYSRYASKVLNL